MFETNLNPDLNQAADLLSQLLQATTDSAPNTSSPESLFASLLGELTQSESPVPAAPELPEGAELPSAPATQVLNLTVPGMVTPTAEPELPKTTAQPMPAMQVVTLTVPCPVAPIPTWEFTETAKAPPTATQVLTLAVPGVVAGEEAKPEGSAAPETPGAPETPKAAMVPKAPDVPPVPEVSNVPAAAKAQKPQPKVLTFVLPEPPVFELMRPKPQIQLEPVAATKPDPKPEKSANKDAKDLETQAQAQAVAPVVTAAAAAAAVAAIVIPSMPQGSQCATPAAEKETTAVETQPVRESKRNEVQEWLLMRRIAPLMPVQNIQNVQTPVVAAATAPATPEQQTEEQAMPVFKAQGQEDIDLEKFEVRKIAFTIEPAAKPVQSLPVQPHPQPFKIVSAEPRSDKRKDIADKPTFSMDSPPAPPKPQGEVAKAEAPAPVRAVVEPPPPPPVARQVSMDVGDAESQVRIVIRERNGDLEVRFDAANDRLRRDLENAAPMLVHELERGSSVKVAELNFSNFGSATESDQQQKQQARAKKQVKSEAVFADLDETAYLADAPISPKSL